MAKTVKSNLLRYREGPRHPAKLRRRFLSSASPLANGPSFRLMTDGTGGIPRLAKIREARGAGQYKLNGSTNDC